LLSDTSSSQTSLARGCILWSLGQVPR
jgi:hypothetical protein